MTKMQIGVDLAKSVFEVPLPSAPGRVRERRRLSRRGFEQPLMTTAPAEVVMEACGSAHHGGRALTRLGHHVTLLHPGDVARYRDGNKTARADAKALLEATRNAALDPVPVKTEEQQALVALHRVRQAYLRRPRRPPRGPCQTGAGCAAGLGRPPGSHQGAQRRRGRARQQPRPHLLAGLARPAPV